jgi:hypothetical protein
MFDGFDVDFTNDARNVRFRLATDGFDPFSTNSATLLLFHLCCTV